MSDFMIISADSHANEPIGLYDRLPEEYRSRAPHETIKGGHRFLRIEGGQDIPIDAPNPLTEEDMRRFFRDEERDEDLITSAVSDRAGGISIPGRLADLKEDGVSAEVIYPHAIFKMFSSPDPGYQRALAELYNDWYHEIFGGHPETFALTAEIPLLDIQDAIRESERVAKMGYKSFSVPCTMPSKPYNHPDYEPFWATAEALNIPVAFHVFTSGPERDFPELPAVNDEVSGVGEDHLVMVIGMAAAMGPTIMLTAANILGRHPDLKFVLVESGIGWLAWVLQTLDELHHKRHMWEVPQLEMLPSEYFRRQGYATFGDDPVGLMTREVIGVDSLMWGSDYPHDEGTFPHSREVIDRIFKDLPEQETRKIVGENAANLYRFSMPSINQPEKITRDNQPCQI